MALKYSSLSIFHMNYLLCGTVHVFIFIWTPVFSLTKLITLEKNSFTSDAYIPWVRKESKEIC